MPEGDTIHRAARTLQQAIGGKVVTRFESVFATLTRVDADDPIRGRTIAGVRAIGKHLLIEFSGGLTLRTHMRMNGSWHVYRHGDRWQKPRSDFRLVIETGDWIAVGFNVPVAEFLDERQLARSREIHRLGQDLALEEFDFDAARTRFRSRGDREVAEVLLDQSVAAGIGNVYKSEVLFLGGVNPFAMGSVISDAEIDQLLALARKLIRHNIAREGAGRETRVGTRPEDRLWVYGRSGKPCRRCGTRIEMRRQGLDARVTFWCPRCQPERRPLTPLE